METSGQKKPPHSGGGLVLNVAVSFKPLLRWWLAVPWGRPPS